jgi:hypothetical protein
MNHKILRYTELLKESIEIDDEMIKDITQDLKDILETELNITPGYLSIESLKKGVWGDLGQIFKRPTSASDKKCFRISISFQSIENCSERNADYPIYNANKIFEILDELSQISKRVGDCYIQFGGKFINFLICSDEEVSGTDTDLYKLYTLIKHKFDTLKSDFGYSTVIRIENDEIIIKTGGDDYTDRKLNLALRGIQIFDKFKMIKTIDGEGLRSTVFNTISKK